jgi:DNA-binding NarL/FixJ family response regulator
MKKNKKISILLADDHAILRHGLHQSLLQEGNFVVVNEAGTGREAVLRAEQYCPAVVIMDINMPELNGIESTRQILSANPGIKVIALSMHCDPAYIMKMMNAGAKGFLLKTCAFKELREAVYTVYAGKKYLCREALDIIDGQACNLDAVGLESPLQRLTIRETEVLQMIAEGHTSNGISEKLNISKRTVDIHRSNLMGKLNLSNTAELVRLAIKEKIIEIR